MGLAGIFVATFILAAATALPLEDDFHKPPASVLPPAQFDATTTTATTTTATTTTATTVTTTTTTTAKTTNTTTPKHTTKTTITTSPPTTHSNTTTHAPTTHSNTTTHAPTTHNATTAHITTHTTPKPEPTPKTNVTVGNFTFANGGKLCVMVQAAIQVHVNRSDVDDTYILQPAATNTSGQCDKNSVTLNISFTDGFIVMHFLKNETTKTVYVSSLQVNLNYAFKSGYITKISQKNDSMQLFTMKVSHSYSCTSESVYMGAGVSLKFSNDRMQAFDFNNNQFGLPDLCKADQPNYTVAIAVGIVLIILIVIVVVAYMISRRKRTDGYQSL
ncbi:lysosome-associated membrane glycoprotein 3 [Brachyhypopomus gauderio]|uniref:lysosome-associated membrane glycoprotein 3 n=1 Tax=Brachyhypopomus gauderio TaxID=698409 RepID=UPI004043804A